jgi:hypothetical protein
MFSVNSSLLFSPEIDNDDDDGNTLKFTKMVHMLSLIQCVLSSCKIGMERSVPLL